MGLGWRQGREALQTAQDKKVCEDLALDLDLDLEFPLGLKRRNQCSILCSLSAIEAARVRVGRRGRVRVRGRVGHRGRTRYRLMG